MKSKLKIKITGKNPHLFLKRCITENIKIYDLEKEEKNLYLLIEQEDFEKIIQMKTSYQIKIIKWYGIGKWKRYLKKYSYLLFFIGLGILCNLFLSSLIFQVEVIHQNQELVKRVKEDLEEFGIQKYHFQVSYQKKEEIKEKILEKEKDFIEWLEIDKIGTKYQVTIEQRKKETKEETCYERHIISKKKAMILEIQASNGEIQKKKNDYVEKGDIIISGFIYNKDKIVQKRCAVGTVYGEVWYRVIVNVPKEKKEKEETGKKRYGLFLDFGNQKKKLGNPYEDYEQKKYPIVGDSIFPISFGLLQFLELKTSKNTLSFQKIEEKALEEAKIELEKLLEEDAVILEKKVLKKRQNNSKIEVTVFCKVKENITDYFDIRHMNIEEMNQERE